MGDSVGGDPIPSPLCPSRSRNVNAVVTDAASLDTSRVASNEVTACTKSNRHSRAHLSASLSSSSTYNNPCPSVHVHNTLSLPSTRCNVRNDSVSDTVLRHIWSWLCEYIHTSHARMRNSWHASIPSRQQCRRTCRARILSSGALVIHAQSLIHCKIEIKQSISSCNSKHNCLHGFAPCVSK